MHMLTPPTADMVYGLTKALVDSSGQAASQCVSELTLSKKGYLVSVSQDHHRSDIYV